MQSISRRKFIQLTSVSGSFLVVGINNVIGGEMLAVQGVSDLNQIELNQFISIGTDNSITLFNHRPEMGQGTFQSIPMILAEELKVDINQVKILQSAASQELYGSQMVVGSRSIRTEFDKLRKMGATARELLKKAAAEKWQINVDECDAKDGYVMSGSNGKLSYGDLVESASKLSLDKEADLTSPKDFTTIGTSVKRRDIPLKTNGQAMFGIDHSLPGMLYATVERSPVFIGKIKSYNKDEILKMPGIKDVLKTQRHVYGRDREGVAILADSYWAAIQARKSLKIEWDNLGLEKVNGETIRKEVMEASSHEGEDLFATGDATKTLQSSSNVIEAVYETPYQAHVPMEPMNALVNIEKDKATFWGSTQNPNGIRSFIVDKYNIPADKVAINYTFMGGGFGRRSMTDVVEEAADLSYQSGKPVKLIWTREDDQTQGPFRACSLNVCRASLNTSGEIAAFEHKVIAQEIHKQVGENQKAGRQLMGGLNTDYLIPNYRISGVLQQRHIPISYWRAVYHSTNPFAQESFIDELAYEAGKDPIAFRLSMLDHPRYRRVLEEIAKKTKWNEPKQPNTGRGVAVVERSGAYFAMVAEVKKSDNKVKLSKISTVIDLGICINPDTVKAQTEGSIVMGLGAVYHGLTVKKGAIAEQNFHTYPMLRMSECPEIVTYILPSEDAPEGAGEAGLPTVAPALANAIFDLTGKRIRKLPLDMNAI